mgnify:FL=1
MSKKINNSPDKGQFQIQNRIKHLTAVGEDESTDEYLESLFNYIRTQSETEQDPTWQKHNLEYDLRTTDVIIQKVKSSDVYAQNLYAALCNNQFIQQENIWDILKEKYWSCSWRRAGGIISDILETGDYIDWYCSGIGADNPLYVSESVVTPEIKNDLKTLGWICIPYDEQNI